MIKHTHSLALNKKGTLDQFDSKCICQICTCHKHKCPHKNVNIPFQQVSTYQKEFVPHPLNTTNKFSTDSINYVIKTDSKYLNTSYGYINSSYREDYPGHKPEMRQKIVPRVKNEEKNVPFIGESWYKSTYKPQSVTKDKLRNKDKEFNPCQQSFSGATTYKSDFFPKRPHSQLKQHADEISYPDGYRFNASTTYSNDFIPKQLNGVKSFKPVENVAGKGVHYLNSTYRNDFNQKRPLEVCPVLTMPKYPTEVNYPSQHVSFDRHTGGWEVK